MSEGILRYCVICGSNNWVQDHHIILKSQVKALDYCPFNHVFLCQYHHEDHKAGVHHNKELKAKLRNEFKATLESLFIEDNYDMKDIQKKLEIDSKATRSICKLMTPTLKGFERENIIRTCLGGEIY